MVMHLPLVTLCFSCSTEPFWSYCTLTTLPPASLHPDLVLCKGKIAAKSISKQSHIVEHTITLVQTML